MSDITRILNAVEGGDPLAADTLLPIVYGELRRLAAQKLSREKPGQTLQATALVHEAYIRLVGSQDPGWQSRGHFFAAAAEAMRRILVDQARRKQSLKHGGGRERVDLDSIQPAAETQPEQVLAVDEALSRLSAEDELTASLVKLRYFAGLTHDEACAALGISPATGHRYWAYGRAWLRLELGGEAAEGG
jgi:RNA polymerase sigma factor (TIGR02999 family)